ncbi:MAG TPA: ABC-ATPase domain-containing protein [Chloroflexota bacterium]|nr:ABC-ATPase domain-containing protein [Chloroflexota bacterium]
MATRTANDHQALGDRLRRIDGRSYGAYREIEGRWVFPQFTLVIDHVQSDPFAPPSRLRALVPGRVAAFPPETYSTHSRAVGLTAFLARRFAAEARRRAQPRGTGHSGLVAIEAPGQEVLPQTAVQIGPDGTVEARFAVGLPAQGRTVLGREAATLLLEVVPAIIAASLRAAAHDPAEVWRHVATNEDADALRAALAPRGLVAFVADGAILPRRSGIDERPLQEGIVVPFEAPPSLRVSIPVPHAGTVTGLGIPRGVTLIVGGGFHGKSTLLRAIERGVYNHRPGDGRERVVSEPGTVKIRAEDGRSVAGVDLSPFIGELPFGQRTDAFSTANASGSTSQAAAIMEALEAGATTLLIDEDTSATNLMIRDRRMQALVHKAHEPITPFLDRVRQLYTELGVSTILVLGGSGDYFDVADTVIAMHAYRPHDVTAAAHRIAREQPTGRQSEAVGPFGPRPARVPLPESVAAERGRRAEAPGAPGRLLIRARDTHTLEFGSTTIDLSAVSQLVSVAQTRAIGAALWFAREQFMDGRRTLAEILDLTLAAIEREGLDLLDRRRAGDLAGFRRFELAAALNRLRTLVARPLPRRAPREAAS